MMRFNKAPLAESPGPTPNPGIGWYHLYTWHIAPPYPDFFYVTEENEQLVLLLLDIGAFRLEPLPDKALRCIEDILGFYALRGKQMILRFVYDTEGRGLVKEPPDVALVKTHMRQAGGIAQKYARSIACIQGIFVGSWGEMHSSRHLSDETMTELMQTLDEALGGSCFLAVRRPSQRRVIEKLAGDGALLQRIGLFNDGIFGSETDLDTYGELGRERELAYQREQMLHTYNGGEALAGKAPVGYRRAAHDFEKMHLSYLNSVYQEELLDAWKAETAQENGVMLSGYDYIGSRLGYRFVVRDVKLRLGNVLAVRIENTGFGNLCKEGVCRLVSEDTHGRTLLAETGADLRLWDSGTNIVVTLSAAQLADLFPTPGSYGISIALTLSDGEVICFSNQNAKDSLFLGTVVI